MNRIPTKDTLVLSSLLKFVLETLHRRYTQCSKYSFQKFEKSKSKTKSFFKALLKLTGMYSTRQCY